MNDIDTSHKIIDYLVIRKDFIQIDQSMKNSTPGHNTPSTNESDSLSKTTGIKFRVKGVNVRSFRFLSPFYRG